MVRAIVAHAEQDVRDLVAELLTGSGRVEIVGTATNGLECLRLQEDVGAEAVFLDPGLPEIGGLEVARRLLDSQAPPVIAFVSCRDTHAARAFDLGAVDYVLRGGDYDAFSRRILLCLSRVEQALECRTSILQDLRELVADLRSHRLHPLQRKLPIRDHGEGTVRLLDPAGVLCVERSRRRTVLCTVDQQYPTYYTIEALEQRLQDDGFFRASPGALLNTNYIQHMIPNGDGSYDVILGDEEGRLRKTVKVSRARSRELLGLLGL